jgi:hypothetical protein
MATMKVRIHYELADGSEDSVLVTGETIEEIRQQATVEVEIRNGINPWSEDVS